MKFGGTTQNTKIGTNLEKYVSTTTGLLKSSKHLIIEQYIKTVYRICASNNWLNRLYENITCKQVIKY